MFRVTKAEGPSCTTIAVDGDLSGEFIGLVETCCDQELSGGKPVNLLLRDLTAIDREGRTLLRRLVCKGVCLLASGVYTSYIVQELMPSRQAGSPSGGASER